MQLAPTTPRASRPVRPAFGSKYAKYSFSDSSSVQDSSGSSLGDDSGTESLPCSPLIACRMCQRHHDAKMNCQSPSGGARAALGLNLVASKKSPLADSHPVFAYPKSPLPALSPKVLARKAPTAALYEAAVSNQATVYAVFGGQGNDEAYFSELRTICERNVKLVGQFMLDVSDALEELARSERFVAQYTQGFDLVKWLQDASAEPDRSYLISAPVSMPLIGFLQLLHFRILGEELGCTPTDLQTMLSGVGGHSQGIVSAAVIASSKTWADFEQKAMDGICLLQSLGARAHQVFPPTSLPPSVEADALANGEGKPTPMLSIQDLPLDQVRKAVAAANEHLGDSQIEVALVNGRNRTVVSGPPVSLHSLNVKLRARKAKADANQAKLPFSQRKPVFHQTFLPATAPFHSSHLAAALDLVAQDIGDVPLYASDLAIPLYSTVDGQDLRSKGDKNIALELAEMILVKPLDWPATTKFPGATTVLEFGPGGASGMAALTNINKEGEGVRVVCVTADKGSNADLAYRPSILGANLSLDSFVRSSWNEAYGPRLVHTAPDRTIVDTKFSRVLGLPPVMVAGMTPTTSCTDFVIAVMNAGYHVELASGGLHNAAALTTAVKKIAANVKPTRGITINVIYASPHTLRWQIPTIANLRRDGYPIEGLTVGAGVPSPEVAGEYIRDLGLRHISFKPGSTAAIHAVIAIAKTHPNFPVILQWTGGRGGGHHSYEDFHQPLLEMYGRIRECSNISLVVGSGLGSAEDTYPYLTGTWAQSRGYPLMPCDGVLLGSRMMVAQEASTSLAAKQAIVDAAGVADHQWEQTYAKPTGGVLTVKSEMGEPIHKLATRGVKFWYEMDHTVFNLKKADMLKQLQSRRDYIIGKLNADCHKVWFGKNAAGDAVDIDEMTYADLVSRIVELTYVAHQGRWIHDSWRILAEDIMTMAQSRFSATASRVVLSSSPADVVAQLTGAHPQMADELVTYKDSRKFIEMCRRKGQKPVPFVPILDESFETWFKKDSLWQSEDVDAVYGQDVGRVCILQGPVAVAHSRTVNEPVKAILDSIHLTHVKSLSTKLYDGKDANVPRIECFGISPYDKKNIVEPHHSKLVGTEKWATFDFGQVGSDPLPPLEAMLNTLGGKGNDWRRAFFTADAFIQGSQLCSNPIKRLFKPANETSVLVRELNSTAASITLFEHAADVAYKVAEVRSNGNGSVTLQILDRHVNANEPAALDLHFKYQPESLMAPFREVMEGRNDRIKQFYKQIWFNGEDLSTRSVQDACHCGPAHVSSENITAFTRCIGNFNDAFTKRGNRNVFAPMDYAVVLSWKALMMPLFSTDLDCDLLKLVHLSNKFEMVDKAAPIREGESISTETNVAAVVNSESGKRIRVEGHLLREGAPVMKIASEFFVRGNYTDHVSSFETFATPEMQVALPSITDVAVLKSKKWFKLDVASTPMLKSKLIFTVNSTTSFAEDGVPSISVTGDVELLGKGAKRTHVAQIEFEDATSSRNPVVEYLKRHGTELIKTLPLENPIVAHGDELSFTAPASNEAYAQVSRDHNPIHVNGALSRYAELPGTITHGMHTSAIVRGLVEHWVCERDIGLFREFNAHFTGMVLPGDSIQVSFEHKAMRVGRKVLAVKATNAAGQTVLMGDAIVEPPPTAYVFTGQGSQRPGMGMDLYAESAAARAVWDYADNHFLQTYGFSIINIVKNNPKELTIRFGGVKGRTIRKNYLGLSLTTQDEAGNIIQKKLFPTIDDDTDAYTFRHSDGLLFATQFTQPALTLMEKAIFEDLTARGLVSDTSVFAGHSLGEYAALSSLVGDAMQLESLVDTAFFRGMSMQVTVPRDDLGRSNYTMCAVDPGRVGGDLNQELLQGVISTISQKTEKLLEIVNYNIINTQYVCAGDIYAIACMTHVLNMVKKTGTKLSTLADPQAHIAELVAQWQATLAPKAGERPELKRGVATIPLMGIDVPFHSKFLMPSVESFRHVLNQFIKSEDVDPARLEQRYVPNLTGKSFEISKSYFELVQETTGSGVLSSVLSKWSDVINPVGGFDSLKASVPILAH